MRKQFLLNIIIVLSIPFSVKSADGSSSTELVPKESFVSGFTAYKGMYFLPVTYSTYTGNGRDHSEVVFQISAKQKIVQFDFLSGYLAYSQRSFWQAINENSSAPVRENDYNPEIFVRTKNWNEWSIDSGLEHESNGKSGLESRGWTRLYLYPKYETEYLDFGCKMWWRIPQRKKKRPDDPMGDDNPAILHYYGYGQISVTLKYSQLYLETFIRFNPVYKKGAFNAELSYPLLPHGMMLMVQYWEGYGESLIDYNVHQRRIGIGV
ncbi:MAG TPA: phospholipase A, partial [Spirochaetota bacterium]